MMKLIKRKISWSLLLLLLLLPSMPLLVVLVPRLSLPVTAARVDRAHGSV